MNKILKISIFLLLIVGIGFAVAKFNLLPIRSGTKQEAKKELWICPMHPTYTSDRQGDCPICGMRLVKKELKEDKQNDKIVERKMNHAGHDMKNMKMPMDMNEENSKSEAVELEIDPAKQQYIGINTTKSLKKNVNREIKALGTIAPDETMLSHIHTKFSGYIKEVFADYEGKLVQKGQPLFTVYSPELVSTQEEYLLALEAKDKLKGNRFPEIDASQEYLLKAARKRLELWDITDEQINKLETTRQATKELTFYSPVNGFITKREAFEGTEITPQAALYDIADLSKVWGQVEVYEVDLPYVMLSQNAIINFPYDNLNPITAKITYIYPSIDPMTRTVKVRLEINNTGFKLKPDMYISANIQSGFGNQIVVPARAVIDSGERQVIFIKAKDGKFTPKEVRLGPEVGNERVVFSGLSEGEEVVTDGNFLLDSESNLETALKQMKPSGGHAGHMM